MSHLSNRELIEKYKSDDRIISDYYKINQNGKLIDVTGIINPLKIDNRQLVSPIDNQGEYGACAGFSAATVIESIYWKKTGKLKQLDSLQVYQLAKQIDRDIDTEGTYLECAMNAVLKLCSKDSEFDFLKNAKINTFFNDGSWNTIELTKQLIHKHDFLQVGFNIDEGWYDCSNVNYVLRQRGMSVGGHAVFICGFDNNGFYIGNQWSKNFGAKGFAIMPYNIFIQQFMYGVYLTGIEY